MAKTGAERIREYRARQKASGAPDSSKNWRHIHKREAKERKALKPFVGCDGEGCGTDEIGRQLYMLFRMGDRELFTGHPLSTLEILDFICDDPNGSILVGFSFGYDVTMILRDLPEKQQRRLFEPKETGEGKSRYVWYKNFDIEYLPKQYFRVRRVKITRRDNGEQIRDVEKGTTRTIYETFGFFQSSFVKAINNFEVGTQAEREAIAADKARRADFDTIGQRERDYCALECQFLADLMEKLRGYCHAAGIYPKSWNGAGKLASALHSLHNTISAKMVRENLPQGLLDFANMAYYGGRFEISRTGLIGSTVYEYDIRSAYPDAMRFLPCLIHGEWQAISGKEFGTLSDGSIYVAALSFNHHDKGPGQLCGFPVRAKEGHLYWPLQGSGIYWSPEIEAGKRLGASVKIRDAWHYVATCDCRPFEWVEPLFDYRRAIGSKGPGYPIKLGINSLYGLLAQRVGKGKYTNLIYAGLITAFTRAKLLDAIALNPGRIAMVATDAVYSLDPLPLDIGERLGQWEADELADLFIVQPGLYWSPDKRKRKSRGLPGKFFEEAGLTEGFENVWQSFKANSTGNFPSRSIPLTTFVGLKLALARGKPELAGTWLQDQRCISFDISNKRDGYIWEGDCICSNPKPGGRHVISLPHRDFLAKGGQEPWENARAMLEDQPDYIDLGPPFQD